MVIALSDPTLFSEQAWIAGEWRGESSAATLEDIVREMLTATTSERQGRVIDHDENASMERKKREGYF